MAIQRRRRFIWLTPKKDWKFSVRARAWGYTASDWSEITLNLSSLPDFVWDSGSVIQAKPIWWNRSIRLLWTPFPARYRKWFDHYIVFRKKGSIPNALELTDAATNVEDSDFFLATVGERKAKFLQTSPGLILMNYYFDYDIEEEEVYYYWVYAVDQKGRLSGDGLNYLGPNNAEWGKPQKPQIVWFETQVHEVNKWMCDVKIWWDSGPNLSEPAGAEYYLVQRRQKNKLIWGLTTRVEHDYNEGRYQWGVLENLIVGKEYDFRVKAVNVPGIGPDALVSDWSDVATYTTLHDTNPPPEVTGVAANRFYWHNFKKGDYVRLRWDRFWQNDSEGVRAPIITEQLAHYNIYRLKGTDAEATDEVTAINLHTGYSNNGGTNDDTVDGNGEYTVRKKVYNQSGKFEGTHFIDDNIEDTSGGSPDVVWDFTWTCEGDSDTERRTASIGGSTVEGTNYGASIQNSVVYAGSWSVDISTGYVEFLNTGEQGINSDEGYVSFYAKARFDLGGYAQPYFFFAYNDDDLFAIWTLGYNVLFQRRGLTQDKNASVAAPTDNDWHFYEARWSVSENTMSIRIDGGTWGYADTGVPLVSLAQLDTIDVGGGDSYPAYMDDISISLTYTPSSSAIAYHYWVTAVDMYGYESDASLVDSYDKVTFEPPPDVSGLDSVTNYTGNFFKIRIFSLKVLWDIIDEATHYQVRIKVKPAGKDDYGLWHYSPLLLEERFYDEEDSTKQSYVYPHPLAHGSFVKFAVVAWNRAGRSPNWVESSPIEILTDEDPPGSVLDSTFRGDCVGFNFFGIFKWLAVNFVWQPRPKWEGVDYYEINIYNPDTLEWESINNVEPVWGLDSERFPWIRQRHTVLARVLPDWIHGKLSATFQIKTRGIDDRWSDPPYPETTVNWEAWWVI